MSVNDLSPGDSLHGFQLNRIEPIDTLNLTLYYLTHQVTGARMLHVACDDDNNLFAVGFRTPPEDSTGVAHILEHTVLCGSERFPVRDPFFSMLKRSLNTFMNAMTASDWTLYPFSSQNKKDFYNLLDIYLDATFFPLISERDFSQEGHRLEFETLDDPTTPLTYKGVVYNEMKGAMADPGSLMHRRQGRHLYPTTTYHHNSGGEPSDIPALTWKQLKEFHAAYYHPSNSYIFSYGNLPLEEQLAFVQEKALQRFDKREVKSLVPLEERYSEPRRVEEIYPLEPGHPTDEKTFVQIAWLTNDINDSVDRLAMSLLSSLLLGNPGAPLYKALLESKLGANLAPGAGYDDENRTTCFATGLQGTDPDKTEAIETLVLKTLEQVASEGFSLERIEGVLHRLEFAHKEVVGDSYPYPLIILMRIMGTWIHGGDPKDALDFDANVAKIRRSVQEGPYFQDLIRRMLLDNPHRITLTLKPDTGLQQREDAEVARRLEEQKGTLSDEAKKAIVDRAVELQSAQEAEEDLSVLPTLELTDITPEEPKVHGTAQPVGRLEMHWFDQPTNGIGYVNLHLPVDDLPTELLPYVPVFCSLMTQVGAAGYDYSQMAERMEAHTGGIRFKPTLFEDPTDLSGPRGFVTLKAKCLTAHANQMYDILDDLFHKPNFKDLDRIQTVLQQIKVSFENGIAGSGHSYAARAAGSLLTPGGRLREMWSGLEQLTLIKGLASEQIDSLKQLSEKLVKIQKQIFCHDKVNAAVTGEVKDFPELRRGLLKFVNYLPEEPFAGAPGEVSPTQVSHQQGYAINAPVSYVARTFRTVPYTHADAPTLQVLAKLLRAGYLHREIREKGGAYGGLASYSAESGLLSLLSYRDPHIVRTLNVYDDAIRWAAETDHDPEAVKEAILSVFSDLDKPLSPGGKGAQEFLNRLQGLTLEQRNQYRAKLLATTAQQLKEVARTYLVERRDESTVAVISNEEALKAANQDLGDETLAIRTL